MFDIGATEILVIAVVAILVVRPKDLPTMLRTIGQYVAKLRALAREFQNQFEEAARDTGIDEVRKGISSAREYSPGNQIKDAFNSIGDDVEGSKAMADQPTEKAAQGTDGPEKSADKPLKTDATPADAAAGGKSAKTKQSDRKASKRAAPKKAAGTAGKPPAAKKTANTSKASRTSKKRASPPKVASTEG